MYAAKQHPCVRLSRLVAIFVALGSSMGAEDPPSGPPLLKVQREMNFVAKDGPYGGRAVGGYAFHPDRRHLATEINHSISIWDIETGNEIVRLTENVEPSAASNESLTFSPDGKRLVRVRENREMVGCPGEITLWDWRSKKKNKTFIGHTAAPWTCCFSPDGHFLATGLQRILLWEIAEGKIIHRFPEHVKRVPPSGNSLPTRVRDTQISSDGKRLAGAWSKTVRIWDRESGKAIRQFSCDYKWSDEWTSGKFSPDLKSLVTINRQSVNDFFIKRWDVDKGEERGSILWELPHKYWVYSPDGVHVIRVDNEEHNIQYWDINPKRMRWFIRPPFRVENIIYIEPDSHRILESDNAGFRVWKIARSGNQ